MDIIFYEIISFTRNQSKTNVSINFKLEKNYNLLEIYCEYHPKKVKDMELTKQAIEQAFERFVPESERSKDLTWKKYAPLSNLITLSLDYEDTYLGCAHRHAEVQKHVICKDNSSLGFQDHEPIKGDYYAVINLHAVISEVVTYHLKVLAK